MKVNRSTKNWMIDAILFCLFIVMFFLDLTGVSLHQWIGVAAGLLALYHLFVHSEWVEAISKRIFGRTTGKARTDYLVDAALLFGFTAILTSGLAISTWLSLSIGNLQTWVNFHVTASIVTMLFVLIKIAIHWRWIVQTARRMTPRPLAGPVQGKPVVQPAAIAVKNDRRDFLKVMGVVGIGSALALLNVAIPSTESEAQTASPLNQTDLTALAGVQTSDVTGSQSTSSSLVCTGRCPKGRSCSYPGQCRQYRDANGNGRCDLGECT